MAAVPAAGFRDVVRRFTFAGDTRPFAVLGRELPLAAELHDSESIT